MVLERGPNKKTAPRPKATEHHSHRSCVAWRKVMLNLVASVVLAAIVTATAYAGGIMTQVIDNRVQTTLIAYQAMCNMNNAASCR